MQEHPKLSQEIKTEEQRVVAGLTAKRDAAMQRFRLAFTLLGSFGLVATFYGFEHIIDNIPALAEHPVVLLIVGVSTLFVTGKLYQKL